MSILWFWDSLPPHPVEHVHSPQLAITPISLPLGPQKDSGHRQLIKMVWLDDFFGFRITKLHPSCTKSAVRNLWKLYHPTTLPPEKAVKPVSASQDRSNTGAPGRQRTTTVRVAHGAENLHTSVLQFSVRPQGAILESSTGQYIPRISDANR